jgi:hypothetical protein
VKEYECGELPYVKQALNSHITLLNTILPSTKRIYFEYFALYVSTTKAHRRVPQTMYTIIKL